MEKNRVYKLKINEFLYIEILYDGSSIQIVSNGNCSEHVVSLVNVNGKSIIKINGLPRCTIDLLNGNVTSNLKVIPTAAVRNYSECFNTKSEDKDFLINQVTFNKGVSERVQNETELHTHFMEILSGEEYLNIILKHIDYLGIDYDGNLCRAFPIKNYSPRELDDTNIAKWLSKDEILSNKELYNKLVSQLSLPIDKQVPFTEINKILTRRTALLDLVGYYNAKTEIDSLNVSNNQFNNEIRRLCSDAKADIYVEILIKSLDTLKKQGIKYVELSFSTPTTIVKIFERLKNYNISGIKFNFLLSENRNADGKSFREYFIDVKTGEQRRNKKSVECWLEKLIDAGYITGFDLMGAEQEVVPNDYIKGSINNGSLYDKLEIILVKLNKYENNNLICRLHAGEFAYNTQNLDGKSNPERILEIIDDIAANNNIIVPPPTIRIGHGIHINKNSNYLRLLRKYGVIIEVNASSNFALGNIKNMYEIPYNWYLQNGIPIVLGTDGGGFYLTTPMDESDIAQMFGGVRVAKEINGNDAIELKKRGI